MDLIDQQERALNSSGLYRPGKEKDDSKLICAAARFVKLRRGSKKLDAGDPYASRTAAFRKSTKPLQPIVTSSEAPKKRKSGSDDEDGRPPKRSKPLPHPLQTERKPLDFGNRIEQALLKIDKWADSWLAGAMPPTDLAWASFEFCLSMPDVLAEGETMGR